MSTTKTIAYWVAAAVMVGAIVALAVRLGGAPHESDVDRFRHLARAHGRPSIDYEVEYPIGSLAVLKGLGLVARSRDEFARTLIWINVVLFVGVFAVLRRVWGALPALVYLAGAVLLGRLLLVRIDYFALAATVAGVAWWRYGRDRAAGASVGVGTALKLWPAPLAFVLAAGLRRRRVLWWFAGVTAVVGAVWLGLSGLAGLRQVLTYRGARGWQVESIGGGILRALHRADIVGEKNALRIGAVGLGWKIALPLVGTIVAAWAAWRAGRVGRVGLGWVASISALVVASTLLSPQFILWLLPGAAIAWAEGDRDVAALVLLSSVLTRLYFGHYHAYITGRWDAVCELLARNAVLLLVVVVAGARLARCPPTMPSRPSRPSPST